MLLNYHEMNVGQGRDSPQQRKQFQVICAVMFSCFVYSAMTSGLFNGISFAPNDSSSSIHMGIFPGGLFTYKAASRDYAAAASLVRQVRSDLGLGLQKEYAGDDILWNLFLDDPNKMGGRRQRWMTGLLLVDDGSKKEHDAKHQMLLDLNEEINKDPLTPEQLFSDPVVDVWPKIPYEQADLPSVDALMLHFPHTGGFVSSLIFSYKVLPKLQAVAREQAGEDDFEPVVLSQCSARESMCTHYVPLVKSKEFLLGRLPSIDHDKALGPEDPLFGWTSMKNGLKKLAPYLSEYVDKLP